MSQATIEELFGPAVDRLKGWREGRGILRFVVENFGATPDPWQEEALLALASPDRDKRRVALQACVGPGKTAVLAWYIWWFMAVMADEGHHPKGMATAITGDNLKQNLWAELAHWRNRSEFLKRCFEWQAQAVFCRDQDAIASWRVEARTWAKTASPEQLGQTFSGLHAKYVTAVIDESGNMPTPILRAAEQALSRCFFGKVVQAGNPTALEGFMLHDATHELRHQWYVIRVTGDPDDPQSWVNVARIRKENPEARAWAVEQIDTYGRENPWVMTQILGQFPPSAINTLLSMDDCEKSAARKLERATYEWMQKRIGIDVARFGDDRTVFAPRQGPMIFKLKVMRNARTDQIAARGAKMYYGWGQSDALMFVDDTGGWGHGVCDQFTVAGIPHVPLVYHAKATHQRYKNTRAEMYIRMQKAVKSGARLPMDRELWRELCAVTYTFSNGQFLMEDKDQVKKRLGKSPDKADALAQTYVYEDQPGGGKIAGLPGANRQGRARTHDDPDARDSHRRRSGRAATHDDAEDD